MKKVQTFSVTDLILLLVIFIIGIALISKSAFIIQMLSWIIAGVLALIGIIKVIGYVISKDKTVGYDSLIVGISMIVSGVLLFIFPNIIDITFRVIFGGWILFTGVNRLLLAFMVMKLDKQGFTMFLTTSLIILLTGIFIIINFYKLIGVFLVIYAVAEIVNYIYFNLKKEKYSGIYNYEPKKAKKQSQIKQEIKDKEAIDAVIDQ